MAESKHVIQLAKLLCNTINQIVSDALLAADRSEVNLLGLLDFSAAFDTVDHDILINCLSTIFGICGSSLTMDQHFYSQPVVHCFFSGEREVY